MKKRQKDKEIKPTSTVNMLVPYNVVSIIIGRGGSTIKEITEQTHARISVNTNNIVGSLEKAITIKGNPENCTNSCRKILEILQQKAIITDNSKTILRILIHDNLIGLIIGEEGNTIRNIMSETETKINVSYISDITIDNINYNKICTIKGSIENISKAESQISAKLRQSLINHLQSTAGCQINVEPVIEKRNFNEIENTHFLYGGPSASPGIDNRLTESLLCILVHSNMVHAIIGRNGSTIKKITQETNAWIHIHKKNNVGSLDKAITIRGNPENCTNACRKILEVLQQKATNSSISGVILKILFYNNLIGIIIGEEGNTIRKIMLETETKINVSSMIDVKIDNFHYKRICTIEGSIKNISKAEAQISAKLRQSIENYLQSMSGYQINVESVIETKNVSEIKNAHVSNGSLETNPAIENKIEFVLRILVPSDIIYVIIGKNGSTIKKITLDTKARVHINKKNCVGSMEKAITIRGDPENCTNACRKILEVLQQKAKYNNSTSDMILKILIHKNLVGKIIGEEGNIIRKIMSETNTNIIVPSITDITIDSLNDERILTIKGSIENISKAQAQISAELRQKFESMHDYKLIRVKPEITNKKYKLIIVGHSNVGKSSIVKRYCQEEHQYTKPTIGMDIHQIFIRFNNETINLEIRDTAGTENYYSLANSCKGVHGIYIVYDITDFHSSNELDGWIKHIETFAGPDTIKILVGSKCDDTSNRKISVEEGQRIAEGYRIPFIEVSSKSNVNIDKLFYTMISKIYDFQHQSSNIKKELDNINVTNKPKLDSDIKSSTIPEPGPMIKKKLVELPEVPNKQSQLNITDTTIYKLGRSNSGISDNKYKLIIVGNSNAGKSSIITRYCNDIYQPSIPTTGMDYYDTCVKFKGKIIQLKIWDTAGTEKYRSLITSYYRGSNGVFMVYDITDLNSLFKLNDWITDIQEFAGPNTIKILVGSKCDDTSNRKISVEKGQRIAEGYRIPFIEVSSKSNVNIDKLFYTMISKIYDFQHQSSNIKKEIYKLGRSNSGISDNKYKLIIVGNSNAGKSSIITRYCNDIYQPSIPTTGMDYYDTCVKFKGKIIQLKIWDTAGTEKYRSLITSYYRGSNGVFMVYDITDLNSLFKLNDWITDIQEFAGPNTIKILVGSKCDDTSNRKISVEKGQRIAEGYRIPFIEVSSKSNVNIDKLFYTMISKIYDFQHQSSNIKKELDNINVTNKPKLVSDIKSSTIPEQGPMIKKKLVELPEVLNKQSQLNITDTTIYKLGRSNSGISDNKYKLIIVGNSNAGKSSIITRYCNDIYQPFIPTIGMDYYDTCVEFKGKIIQLKIWDTAGTEKYRSLSTSYYRGSNGVFIVYDITDLNSLFKLNDWITDIQEFAGPDTIKILVGSKCDDTSNRKISVEEGQRIAEEYKIPFIEVSSKTNVNIDKLFYTMISKIHEMQEQKPKTILEVTNSPSTNDVIHIKNNEFSNQENKKDSSTGCSC